MCVYVYNVREFNATSRIYIIIIMQEYNKTIRKLVITKFICVCVWRVNQIIIDKVVHIV